MTEVWKRSRHSGSGLLMMLALADHSDDAGNSYPSVSTLAAKCRMKPRNANLVLAALRDSGELQIKLNEGPKGTNRYRIVLAALGVQPATGCTGLQGVAGDRVQPATTTPVAGYSKPLQPATAETSLNRQEPLRRQRRSKFDAAQIQLPAWLDREDWQAWVSDRADRGKPITQRAAKLQIAQLDQYRYIGHSPHDVITHCIAGGFQGLFPPKGSPRRNAGQPVLGSDDIFGGAH